MSFLTENMDTIINADCMDVLKKLPDKCVDLVLTDPPYFKIVKNDWDNQWKDIFDFQNWVGEVGKEIKRVLRDNGSFYWFGDDKIIAYCQVELDKYFRLLNSLVWRKTNFLTRKGTESVFQSYAPISERCLFYDKGEENSGLKMVKKVMPNPIADYLKNELMRKFGTIAQIRRFVVNELKMDSAMVNRWFDGDSIITKEKWEEIKRKLGGDYLKIEYEELRKEYEKLRKEYEELRRVWNNDSKAFDVLDFTICQNDGRFHPTQKPLALIKYLVERSTRQGALVLDCFSGSGTTAVACHNLGRHFICVEKDPDYWAASMKRLEDVRRQMTIFDVLEA